MACTGAVLCQMTCDAGDTAGVAALTALGTGVGNLLLAGILIVALNQF